MAVKASTMKRGMNFWPPLWFAGVQITHIGDDYRSVEVELRKKWYNKNYVGVHFGGSIFSMTDPFFMMMVMNNLSRDYTVWDKEGSIQFLKPGVGTLKAKFELTDEMLADIKANTLEEGSKYQPTYSVDILNSDGEIVAKVQKRLHIRKRKDNRARIGG